MFSCTDNLIRNMQTLLILFTLLISALTTLYLYIRRTYSYWERRGVTVPVKPIFPFGNFKDSLLQKKNMSDVLKALYNSTDEGMIGVYTALQPTLFIRDPKIIQDICTKNFLSFHARGYYVDIEVDPMADNLLLQSGERWRFWRSKLSSAFSSGKLKSMVQSIVDCGTSLENLFVDIAKSGRTANVSEIFAQFTTSVIVSFAFGIEMDCIKNQNSEFRDCGKRIFGPTIRNHIRSLNLLNSKLGSLLRLRLVDKEVEDFLIDTVRRNLKYREENHVSRKDFFQLLIQIRNTGEVQDDIAWSLNESNNKKLLSEKQIAAQFFLFFAAGFESTSTTISLCMYEMAKNKDVQERAYEDIKNVLQKYDQHFIYDSINEMKYVDNCISETLRKYPPFPSFSRTCTEDYQIPDSSITIEKGTSIFIPIIGLHYDPQFYDEPKKFDPERFSDNRNKNSADVPYLPFGTGPRSCIGMRLARMTTKFAVSLLLSKFRFELEDDDEEQEIILSPKYRFTVSLNGINLKVFKR